ncbi:F0F1 ATP synthase subunit epsilon [Aquicella lusitana]|mgnify:FL=1|uniref:ATP synthase epsilon chain n=1 Tax=Aquicella lusitana TaxID=254246 RepID=A0A370GS81_9COXI|nr:F0F1 ATP synthase subunit epsilon [Aquicella lusitana]RDI46565.1 ATP synthase F1 subcomplex epsilon subunit [Aquicella lusitana]VVC74229.1 ATP synthase epsilon chain [Aquicella lusitana]
MTKSTLRLDIVSAEKEIFSGEAEMVFVTGELGELGIAPGHSQLLTTLRPGYVRTILPNKEEEVFFISGGMLEVQPYIVSVLADTAMRAADIDEAAALQAKEQAEKALAGKISAIDLAKATAELAEISAQIRAIQRLKKRARGERA